MAEWASDRMHRSNFLGKGWGRAWR